MCDDQRHHSVDDAKAVIRSGGIDTKLHRSAGWLAWLCALALFLSAPPPAQALRAEVAGAAALIQYGDALPWYLSGSCFVYITPTGECYHTKDDCPGIKTAYLVSLEEAIRLDYRDCGRCRPTEEAFAGTEPTLPEDEPIVYLLHDDTTYHNANHLQKNKTRRPVTLDEAAYLGRTACPICFPNP